MKHSPSTRQRYTLSLLSLAVSGALLSSTASANMLIVDGTTESSDGASYNTVKMGYGAVNIKNGGVLNAENMTATTTGTYSDAVSTGSTGTTYFNGGYVSTQGGAASGFHNKGGTTNIGRDSAGNGTRIEISGRGSAGIRLSGGVVNADGVTIINSGMLGSEDLASAVEADPGSTLNLSNASLQTLNENVHGALIKSSQLSLTNSAVSTQGKGAAGVNLLYSAVAAINGGTIETSGEFAHGVRETGSSQVTIDRDSNGVGTLIHTSGDASRGVFLYNNARADITGATIITDGNRGTLGGAEGVGVQNNGQAQLRDSQIIINGFNSDGLDANGADLNGSGSAITMQGGSITNNGDSGKGAVAYGGNSAITLDGTVVTTTGSGNRAIAARDSGSSVSANNALLQVNGDNSGAASAIDGGTVNLAGSQATTRGANGYGLNVTNGGVLNASNSRVDVTGANGTGIALEGGTVNLSGSQVSVLDGKVMNFLSDVSTVNVLAGSVLQGDAVSASAAASNIVLDNASWNGNASEISSVDVRNNAVWRTNGNSTVGGLNLDDGTLIFDPVSDTGSDNISSTMTVRGNYAGNNGTIQFNTVLGGDDSPTNKMIVDGDTSGVTYVSVNNLGGKGAPALNGIELIEVNGKSDGEFVQKGRIVAGAYDYFLARGAGANTVNWYLSNFESGYIIPPGEGDGEGGASGDNGKTPKPVMILRPEGAAYAANIAAANNLFNLRLHDRLGETNYVDALTGQQKVTSLWLRSVGGHTRANDGSGQLKTQANRYIVQLGGDVAQWSSNGDDRYHLGVMGGYANQQSNSRNHITGAKADGSISGYSAGVYATWLQDNAEKTGAYVDSWAQYSWFNNSVKGQDLSSESYKSKGISASVESGYTWKIGEKNPRESYYIQPKAQVTWMGVTADDHTESNGTRVSGIGDGNIQTRLGLRSFIKGHSKLDDGKQRTFEPFVEANWIHNSKEFGSQMNGVAVTQKGTRNIGELKVGVEGQISPNVNLWGNVAQQMGGNGYSDTQAIVGVKYNF